MINPNDFEKLEHEESLEKAWELAKKHWEDESNKATNITEYDATKPLFEKYMEDFQTWQRYFYENYSIFMAKKK